MNASKDSHCSGPENLAADGSWVHYECPVIPYSQYALSFHSHKAPSVPLSILISPVAHDV
jgi:hypothetical protein